MKKYKVLALKYRKIGAVSKIASTGWFKEQIECDSTIKLE